LTKKEQKTLQGPQRTIYHLGLFRAYLASR